MTLMWLTILRKVNWRKHSLIDNCRDRQSCKVLSMCEIKLRVNQIPQGRSARVKKTGKTGAWTLIFDHRKRSMLCDCRSFR
jgi:hypothetical protein